MESEEMSKVEFKRLLRGSRMQQNTLAEIVGVHESTISGWKKGRSSIDPSKAPLIRSVLTPLVHNNKIEIDETLEEQGARR